MKGGVAYRHVVPRPLYSADAQGPRPPTNEKVNINQTCTHVQSLTGAKKNSNYTGKDMHVKWLGIASFPGPAQLSVAISTEKRERAWYLLSRE